MAKSFKQLATKPEMPKRISEKDILDFLEQEQPPGDVAPSRSRETSNTSNIIMADVTSVDRVRDVTDEVKRAVVRRQPLTASSNTADQSHDVIDVTAENFDVRQTFVVGKLYLDKLKDYVHTKRMAGQYEYTQKQALHDALDKLFEGAAIEERPLHIRQQEEIRKQQIRRGIGK